MTNNRIKTQVRFPAYLWEYITQEAERKGIAKNAIIIQIIDEKRKEDGYSDTLPLSRS